MKLIKEHINFERGLDPKEAMGTGDPIARMKDKISQFLISQKYTPEEIEISFLNKEGETMGFVSIVFKAKVKSWHLQMHQSNPHDHDWRYEFFWSKPLLNPGKYVKNEYSDWASRGELKEVTAKSLIRVLQEMIQKRLRK